MQIEVTRWARSLNVRYYCRISLSGVVLTEKEDGSGSRFTMSWRNFYEMLSHVKARNRITDGVLLVEFGCLRLEELEVVGNTCNAPRFLIESDDLPGSVQMSVGYHLRGVTHTYKYVGEHDIKRVWVLSLPKSCDDVSRNRIETEHFTYSQRIGR